MHRTLNAFSDDVPLIFSWVLLTPMTTVYCYEHLYWSLSLMQQQICVSERLFNSQNKTFIAVPALHTQPPKPFALLFWSFALNTSWVSGVGPPVVIYRANVLLPLNTFNTLSYLVSMWTLQLNASEAIKKYARGFEGQKSRQTSRAILPERTKC